MNYTYNTLVLTVDEVVPTVQSKISAGQFVENLYNVGDAYIVTFGTPTSD